jgi:iron complex transport system substrate-binding protein
VIADASAQGHLAEAFTGALGDIPVLFVGALGYDDVAASIRLLGQVTDHQAEAEAAATAMESALAEIEASIAGMPAPRVLIMNGALQDLYVALPDSFVGDLVSKVGGDNVAAEEPQSGPYPGYTQLSLETIAEKNPDVILTITAGGPSLADAVLADATFAATSAVEEGRVHDIDLEIFLQAPGPRAVDGLHELARLLYGIE